MFSIAYVILPFSDIPPGDAIRASLAPFQVGGRREKIPDEWLTFQDGTEGLRMDYGALFTFIDVGKPGLQVEGGGAKLRCISEGRVKDEMHRRGLQSWQVRFADIMDQDTFVDRFTRGVERGPVPGTYGYWSNPLGRWDFWALGGRFDGNITGQPESGTPASVAHVPSGLSGGFYAILLGDEGLLDAALGQAPASTIDVRNDRNIELAATLLANIRWKRAYPDALVLPPGSVATRLRWLGDWKERADLEEVFIWLGLPPDASWREVVEATYVRFKDHWVAGVAYHH
jgi:hypothetical protein